MGVRVGQRVRLGRKDSSDRILRHWIALVYVPLAGWLGLIVCAALDAPFRWWLLCDAVSAGSLALSLAEAWSGLLLRRER